MLTTQAGINIYNIMQLFTMKTNAACLNVILVFIFFFTDYTLTDELEKGLSVLQVNLLRILGLRQTSNFSWDERHQT